MENEIHINTYKQIKKGALITLLGIIFLIASFVIFGIIEVGGIQLTLPILGIVLCIIGLARIFNLTSKQELSSA